MAKSPAIPADAAPLVLVCGDDDFGVKQRARQLFEAWCREAGGMDHETIDAAVGNTGDALAALARLREALNTLPFFGGSKVVWFQNCTFLGEDRTSGSAAVTESLASLADELKAFRWDGVRLLVSAAKPDKRRVFYKTLEKIGTVEQFAALSADDRDWVGKAESEALRMLRALGRTIDDDALGELVARTGPNLRQIAQEAEKLAMYAGARTQLALADVQTVSARQKTAQAFALAEAVGDRNLTKLLKTLDEELWEIRNGVDKRKSEIGLLYGVITKIRMLLLMKEIRDAGHLKPARDYNSFKAQMERVGDIDLPADKKFNPFAAHPFVVFQAFRQT
ncbi:MAG: DNA polymerase III subunit delta, partial [Verrucomicrobia bacterium]